MNRKPGDGTAQVAVRRYRGGDETDAVAVEEPLLIRLQWPEDQRDLAVTMRTPGNDAELAVGFLVGEGLLGADNEVTHVDVSSDFATDAVVTVSIANAPAAELLEHERNFYMTSSCGVCGKAALEAVRIRANYDTAKIPLTVSADVIRSLPQRLLAEQPLFAGTGSLHAAAFFAADGTFSELYEDVGRHNAVDKLVGAAFRDGGLPAVDRVMVVSGRASFELVQKARLAGCGMLVAVGAPSSLAVELAWEAGMTLVGFAREDRFNVYSVPTRIPDLS
ncbi:MAG: formate dehydrogenase accessory sulfurtransferase FdhD [Gammaproteobacteria bacterium]|nr:formate dehydrogenase accessory sulfurtransferase FdhD [Gammaproteobacteria bacterium]NND55577.1 formate dehydrogenase accessory sulfurtransferase FdhD [Gammaproteobacteria bacterium]